MDGDRVVGLGLAISKAAFVGGATGDNVSPARENAVTPLVVELAG